MVILKIHVKYGWKTNYINVCAYIVATFKNKVPGDCTTPAL